MMESTGVRRARHRPLARPAARAALIASALAAGPLGAQEAAEVAAAPSAEERGLAIAREVDRRIAGYRDLEARLTMVLVSREGRERKRELAVSALAAPDGGERTLLVFRSPRDLAGTALLSHARPGEGDDQWLYLPAMKRVKRIAASARSGSFMGTEFAYEDIGSQEVALFTYRYEGETRVEGRAVHVVDRFPVDPASGYSRQRVYVDRDEVVPVRIEYFDGRGEHRKTLVLTDYTEHGPYRRAGLMRMENHRSGAVTRLEWSDIRFDVGLAERRFTPDGLARAGR